MAKKKKNRNQPETPAAAASRESPAGDKGASPSSLERAFAVGNFSAVRRLAAQQPGPDAARLLALVKIDRTTLFIGLGALLFMVLVALMVLRS